MSHLIDCRDGDNNVEQEAAEARGGTWKTGNGSDQEGRCPEPTCAELEADRSELTPIFRAPDKGGNAYLCPAQTARRFVYAAVCTTRAQYAAS